MPNRDQKTEISYAITAKQLRSQATRAYGYTSPNFVPLTTLAEYIITRKPTYARNTWKQYKNALRAHIEAMIDNIEADRLAVEEGQAAIHMLDRETSEGCMKAGTRTSSLKQKTFKKADFDKLIAYLETHVGKHKFARTLSLWLRASRLTGMRPSEWEHADLIQLNSTPALTIRNAKATNGRANGEERTLLLDMLSKDELAIIEDMIKMVEGHSTEMQFAELQKVLGDYMNRATRKCFGKRQKYPTLYSNRHQFSADAKLSGHTKAEVAALLGQASDETAGTHYARAVSGESAIKVSPLPSEVKTVRTCSRTFVPRRRKDVP